MRILFVIDSLRVGGAETLLLDLLDAARARGDQAEVAYFSPGPLEPEVDRRGIKTTRLSHRGLKDPLALWRALRLIQRFNPDVVHSHLTKSDLVGQLAARLAGRRRVVTLHNNDPWRTRSVVSAAYHLITGRPDAMIAVSPLVADYVAQHGGVPREQIEVIRNGVDLKRFSAQGTVPLDLSQFGVAPDALVVAKVGRLNRQKDHANFLQTAAILAKEVPKAHFLVVGDGELMADTRALAQQLGLDDSRLTFTGNIRQMPELLAALDLFVLASAWEGLPMVLLEAMAMGVPVVSTAVGGVPALITDGANGRLAPASDPKALAQAAADLLTDASARGALGAAGQDTVRRHYSGRAMTDRIWSIYQGRPGETAPPEERTEAVQGSREWNI